MFCMKGRISKSIQIVIISIFFMLTAYFVIIPFFEPSSIHLDINLPLWVFYTIQTNIFVCVWYGFLILNLARDINRFPGQVLTLAITIYILITGIVYWAVLIPMLGAQPALFRFRNIWTHTVTPLFTLLCFFVYSKKERISFQKAPYVFIYPFLYLVFSYLFVFTVYGKYPYPFLNPEIMGGFVPVAASCLLISLLFLGLFTGLRYLHNKRIG